MSDYMVEQTTGDRGVRYKPIVVAIHWLTAALIVTQVYIGFLFHRFLPEGSPERMEAFTWHKTLGATILVLALIRLAVRLMNPPPPYPDDMPKWERFLAVWNHRIFYVLIIVSPLAGLIAVSGKTEGATTPLVGGFPLPVVPGISEGSGELSGEVHEWLVYTTLALLVLHIGAALKHQFVDRGPTADRMWPFRSTRR